MITITTDAAALVSANDPTASVSADGEVRCSFTAPDLCKWEVFL